MIIQHIKDVFIDLKLISYWPSRALLISIQFLTGFILHSFGYSVQEILLYWFFIYMGQLILFSLGDMINPCKIKLYQSICFCIAILGMTYLLLFPNNMFVFSICLIFIQPILRETTNTAILYIRVKKTWDMGVNSASSLLNEGGKGLGALYIAIIGFILLFGFKYCLIFIIINLLVIYWFHHHHPIKLIDENFNHVKIPLHAKTFLLLSAIHNGIFFSTQSFMTLVIAEYGMNNKGMISEVATIFATIMLLVILFIGYIKAKRQDKAFVRLSRNMLIPFCLLINSFLILIMFNVFQRIVINIDFAKLIILIGVLIGILQAFGSLYSLGMQHFLDILVTNTHQKHLLQMKKRIINLNSLFCCLTPGIALFGLYGLYYFKLNMESITPIFLTLSITIEILLAFFFYKLTKKL